MSTVFGNILRFALSVGVLLLAAAGCGASSAQSTPPAAADIVAEVGDRRITLEEVDRKALALDAGRFNGMRLQHALYAARREIIDQLISEYLLDTAAKTRGISRDALIQQDVTSKIAPVQDADLQAWYQANPARVRGAPLEKVKERIHELLEKERREVAMQALIGGLRGKVAVRVSLTPPRQEIAIAATDPTRGPAAAPVQIVEYSDFE